MKSLYKIDCQTMARHDHVTSPCNRRKTLLFHLIEKVNSWNLNSTLNATRAIIANAKQSHFSQSVRLPSLSPLAGIQFNFGLKTKEPPHRFARTSATQFIATCDRRNDGIECKPQIKVVTTRRCSQRLNCRNRTKAKSEFGCTQSSAHSVSDVSAHRIIRSSGFLRWKTVIELLFVWLLQRFRPPFSFSSN